MGSFCIQCCVSQQVISDDEKCVILPIRQERTFNPAEVVVDGREPQKHYGSAFSGCHPGSHWGAHGGFLTGTYADYGNIELDDSATNRVALASLFHDLVSDRISVPQGENPSHDVPFDLVAHAQAHAPAFTAAVSARQGLNALTAVPFDEFVSMWEHLANAVSERRAFVLDNFCVVRPLEFAVLHRAAFDELLAMGESKVGYRKESYARVPLVSRKFEELKVTLAERLRSTAPAQVEGTIWFYARRLVEAICRNPPVELAPLFRPYENALDDRVGDLFKGKMSLEAFVEAAGPMLDAAYVINTMDELNLRFSPVAYGGQDYDNEAGRRYARFIRATASAVTRQVRAMRAD